MATNAASSRQSSQDLIELLAEETFVSTSLPNLRRYIDDGCVVRSDLVLDHILIGLLSASDLEGRLTEAKLEKHPVSLELFHYVTTFRELLDAQNPELFQMAAAREPVQRTLREQRIYSDFLESFFPRYVEALKTSQIADTKRFLDQF